ncbi:NAD-P-binding protein [Hyaloraphidium curvatum]|nr:NAD-P-binding protein [Hyaloraphidium curvatum]
MAFGFDTTAEEAAAAFASGIAGKNVLITGASPGSLGAECARVLAKHGAALIVLAGRNPENLKATQAAILAETPKANIRLLQLDLVDLDSVRKAADEVLAYKEPIHVLYNNAATMATPYRPAPKGLESQFWGNHVGHFLFTKRVLPKVLESASGDHKPRVINVSSRANLRSGVRFDDMGFKGGETYDPWIAYGQSKTANVLFSRELAKRYGDKLITFSLHPGGIRTNLSRDLTEEARQTLAKTLPAGFKYKTIESGTSTHICAGFDPSIVGSSGSYMQDCAVDDAGCADWARDMDAAKKLWDLSEELIEEKW